MRPVDALQIETSLERGAALLRESTLELLPVQHNGALAGVLTQRTLAQALARGCDPADSVEVALSDDFQTIGAHATGAEALRLMNEGNHTSLLVVGDGHVLGIASASDLYPKRKSWPKPPSVGGMATPFGVYLTTGGIGAGVSPWALVSTGMVMGSLLLAGTVVMLVAQHYLDRSNRLDLLWSVLPGLFFLVGLRLLPMSGIHAAEHKVVHAIERGESLDPEVVARMPRVHPRCGTNIAAGAMIFFGVSQYPWIADPETRFVVAALLALFFWRWLGSGLQWLLTTRPPNRRQIEMGVKSGRELLDKYRYHRGGSPNPFVRLWNSGLLHVIAGFAICSLLVWAAAKVLNVDSAFVPIQ